MIRQRVIPKINRHSFSAISDSLYIFAAIIVCEGRPLHPQPEDTLSRGDKRAT